MSLDLDKVTSQIQSMASGMRLEQTSKESQLYQALRELDTLDSEALEKKRLASKNTLTWLVPGLPSDISQSYPCPPMPESFSVLATDGSHIDIDRHLAARCYLINIGLVKLVYGSAPNAVLENRPKLYFTQEDLVVSDPESSFRNQQIIGPLLAIKRAVEELQSLYELARESPSRLPTIALLDGSLVMFPLAGRSYPEFVRKQLLIDGFLSEFGGLEGFRQLNEAREFPIALASFISLPGSKEVVDALRLSFCPYSPANCDKQCGGLILGDRPCDVVSKLSDQHLFQRILGSGERSAVFASSSSVVSDYYGDHKVHFYYVNVGSEISRVEIPQWVAQDQFLLDLSHALIVDQCKRGLGYPVAISEAHELAVVNNQDRRIFQTMVEDLLGTSQLPIYTSEKNFSKRLKSL